MTSSQNWYSAVLTCNHDVVLVPLPSKGDTVYCRRCRTWRVVVFLSLAWRYSCRRQGCMASTSYGSDRGAAYRAAVRHLHRWPGHQVWIYRGASPFERVEDVQVPLPEPSGKRALTRMGEVRQWS